MGYDTLLLRMIPGDLLSAFPHRQFHTLPGLLDSRAALPNSYPNALRAMQGGSLYHFYDGLWYDPAERRTHDLPCERRTRYRLSQPDTVPLCCGYMWRTWMLLSNTEGKTLPHHLFMLLQYTIKLKGHLQDKQINNEFTSTELKHTFRHSIIHWLGIRVNFLYLVVNKNFQKAR